MIYEDRIRRISERDTLVAFLRDELNWPAPPDLPADEMFYDYSADELRLDAQTAERVRVRQLASFSGEQPWGVFLLEATSRVYATQLRRVLRALAPGARSRPSNLPAWPAENLLFIATHNYKQFTFAHFRGERAATARLSTFGWGHDEAGLRTLCEHNLPALAWPDDERDAESWLKQWDRAFDVEAVTDKFFKEFRDLFEDTKARLPKSIVKPADRHAFTQRLLNRLLFLCFLQKKRWLRAPDLRHPRATYLFDLFDNAQAQGEEFYGSYLHDLFFKALNRPPASEDARLHDRVALRLGIVPFLNGGLFDPTDALDLPGAVALPNKLFQSLLGRDGLLRRYNFTVTESTPLNQEVAVDPEMLGKVFETVVLTSEEAQDYQAPNLRKATGSYYTPRIVVTFIVRETLKDYLAARVPGLAKAHLTKLMEVDAAGGLSQEARAHLQETISQGEAEAVRRELDELRACDPAVGSGAFALGLLHELVNLHILCETVERGKDPRLGQPNLVFDLKKRIIERNIYGVDLQAKAVEICKLRLWLSLIVDYQVDVDLEVCTEHQFERAIGKIPALPNLSYKIRRGDSLLDLVHGRPFRMKEITHSVEMQDERAGLERAQRQFFGAEETDAKRRLRLHALVHRTRLTRLQLESQRAELLNSGTQTNMFDKKEARAAIRQRQAALAQVDAVLAEVKKTEAALEPLSGKKHLTPADDALLTELEASSEGEAITFTWELDFPEIFSLPQEAASTMTGKMRAIVDQTPGQMELPVRELKRGGFDIVLGNPPFVTARNREKRELYRARWRETCHKTFQLVAPFFQRSLDLLKPGGHLGFIVSNAFAKREFGRPLVEDFFPTVELSKVVDCSGLMFPGHGTPTCIVFGRRRKPAPDSVVRVAATLPGGGDLRTLPERSPLWAALYARHDQPGYSDARIIVADRPRQEMAKWPWNPDVSTEPLRKTLEAHAYTLSALTGSFGSMLDTHKDEAFVLSADQARRHRIEENAIAPLVVGDRIRDWQLLEHEFVLKPYDGRWKLRKEDRRSGLFNYLRLFRNELGSRATFGGPSYDEASRPWYAYHQISVKNITAPFRIVYPEISTHGHFVAQGSGLLFPQTAPLICLMDNSEEQNLVAAAVLNSSAVLLWLKGICFNKGVGDEEERDRFEYAAGKVQQLPIPSAVLESAPLRDRLTALSRACWERGQQLPALAFKKLFEVEGEAYQAWNSSLAGWVPTHASLPPTGFRTAAELLALRDVAVVQRERLRREMIALQEEMDWLVYAAYGLLPLDHPAVGLDGHPSMPEPLALGERPFELARDGLPIPARFPPARRALWEARLGTISANEHIQRIEQPIYKRRWYRKQSDEQEFRRALEWWLLEKAEWWLEHKAEGGPVALEPWAAALWQDERVRAAVEAAEARSLAPADFARLLRSVVVETTVPDWIPPAMPWQQVEKKFKAKRIPARAKRIRGKLNVPRERFRLTAHGEYIWAGKDSVPLRAKPGR